MVFFLPPTGKGRVQPGSLNAVAAVGLAAFFRKAQYFFFNGGINMGFTRARYGRAVRNQLAVAQKKRLNFFKRAATAHIDNALGSGEQTFAHGRLNMVSSSTR